MTAHELYMKYLDAMILFACKYVDRADAEDVVAELYFRIREKGDLHRDFLFKSVYNACMNLLAKKKPIHELPDIADESPFVIEAEVYKRITTEIGKLSNSQQRILRLGLGGLTNSQIASVMGVSEYVVRNEKSRAIRKLRKIVLNK